MKKLLSCLLLTSFVVISPLYADPSLNQVSIHASASLELDNDEMHANLVVQRNGKDTAALSNSVNLAMTQILNVIQRHPTIKAQSSNYTTQPSYKEGEIQSWHVKQTLKLNSLDFEAMTKALSDVNGLADIESLTFSISDSTLEKSKANLTQQAIANFKEKARLVTHAFDMASYKIMNVSINDQSYRPQFKSGRVMMMSDAVESSGPALSAGTDTVTVNVQGNIQLLE
jgi:predicted secreted protein